VVPHFMLATTELHRLLPCVCMPMTGMEKIPLKKSLLILIGGRRADMLVIHLNSSAPAAVVLRKFGFTVDNVCARAKALLAGMIDAMPKKA
jgi:hypothetical protein